MSPWPPPGITLWNEEAYETLVSLLTPVKNSIPIEMIRAVLTGQMLTRNFKSSWPFYDELKPPPHETNGEPDRAQ